MAIVFGLFGIVVAAGWPVYVRPQIDSLRPADAIFVLGGPFDARYSYGIELAERGLAPELVMSTPNPEYERRLVQGRCDHRTEGYTVTCFVPDPATTKGEGRELRRLAAEHGWRSVIVVTFTPHVSRARHIIESCFDGAVIMAASPADISLLYWAYAYVYQTAGYIRSLVQPGC